MRLAARRGDTGWTVDGFPSTVSDGTLILLSDPFTFPVDGLLPQLRQRIPDLAVIGGLASGSRSAGGNRLVHQGVVIATARSASSCPPASSPRSSPRAADRIGEPFIITAADRNVVLELGGRPGGERLRELIDSSTKRRVPWSGGVYTQGWSSTNACSTSGAGTLDPRRAGTRQRAQRRGHRPPWSLARRCSSRSEMPGRRVRISGACSGAPGGRCAVVHLHWAWFAAVRVPRPRRLECARTPRRAGARRLFCAGEIGPSGTRTTSRVHCLAGTFLVTQPGNALLWWSGRNSASANRRAVHGWGAQGSKVARRRARVSGGLPVTDQSTLPRRETDAFDQRAVEVIRGLAMDAPHAARSGHQGTAMALAPLAHVLFSRILRYDASAPDWPDRDRFVLSAGHASVLQYAMLHLAGFGSASTT